MHDLVRVSAHDATSVLLMLSAKDAAEADASDGKIQNGATIRGLLALRHVLFSSLGARGAAALRPQLRVTVQVCDRSMEKEKERKERERTTACVVHIMAAASLHSTTRHSATPPSLTHIHTLARRVMVQLASSKNERDVPHHQNGLPDSMPNH